MIDARDAGAGRPPGRNESCPCGSGAKYKHCCQRKDRSSDIGIDPPEIQFRRGVALERLGRIDEAIAAYQFVAPTTPSAHEANSRLGNLFLGLGRSKEAAAAFRAAASASPESPKRRMDLVRALVLEKKDAEAEAEVRGVLADNGDSADAHWVLGRILTESGRFAEAAAALERSVTLNPDQGIVYCDLVRTRTLTGSDRPLIRRMLGAARSLSAPDERVKLHLALGKAYDDLADYGSAMRHFAKANQIKKSIVSFDRTAFGRQVDTLIERFSPEFLAAHVGRANPSRTPVMIVGMPRSGTTLVEQILSSHGDIAGAGELQFWTARGGLFYQLPRGASVEAFQTKAAQDCLAMLGEIAPGASRVTDKNPFNFFCAGLIHLVFPRATIIHCRRSAVDTCLSISSTYFAPRPDFSTDPDDLVFYYQQYLRLIDHWRAILPTDCFIDVDYEVLIADPESVSRGLIAACGLVWDPACLRPQHNVRTVRTSSQWQVRQPIYRTALERWRRYEPWLGALRALIPDAMAER